MKIRFDEARLNAPPGPPYPVRHGPDYRYGPYHQGSFTSQCPSKPTGKSDRAGEAERPSTTASAEK